MPKHIVRLIILIGVFGVVFIGAKAYFTAESFGMYGHYRADSVAEIAAATPIYQGSKYCKSCHSKRHAEWSTNIHKAVTCEACHGAAGKHPATGKPSIPTDKRTHSLIASKRYSEPTDKLSVPADTVKLCTLCHEKMPARPATQPQIDVSKHAGTQQCVVCHNPHSPKLAQVGIPKAALAGSATAGKAKASSCAGCHGTDGVSSNPAWPNLAGQQQAYLVNALKAYKAGTRKDGMMTGLMKNLNDKDIRNLAAYYASLSCRTAGSGTPKADATAGKAKASSCAGCHGAKGVSSNPAWPSLAGQQQAYLVNALKAYKAGTRKDAMMARLVKDLNDTDIKNLAAYYASSSCK